MSSAPIVTLSESETVKRVECHACACATISNMTRDRQFPTMNYCCPTSTNDYSNESSLYNILRTGESGKEEVLENDNRVAQ